MDRYLIDEELKEKKSDIIDMMKELPTDDDRFDILAMFCNYCWRYTDYTECHCENDD